MRPIPRSRGSLLCLLVLIVNATAFAQADGTASSLGRSALLPLAGDAESFAFGINDRGVVVGHSLSADTGSGTTGTGVMWDRDGNPTALPPLEGDTESFAVAINRHGAVVGRSRDTSGACPRDTAVMWLPDGSVTALEPLGGDRQSVADGISDDGLVAGTSKSFPDDPEVDCTSLFTPVYWNNDGSPEALAPLDGFPEGFAMSVTSNGDVIGGSANTTTGFDFQGTIWRSRRHRARLLEGPANSFLNTPWSANAAGMVVGDSYDFSFTQSAVVWDIDGLASLRSPLTRDSESSGRAINRHGEVAGRSVGSRGVTAVIWTRKGKPTGLRPLLGDSDSEALAINRSGQVAGRSFGAGVSTAVVWRTR